MVENILLQTNIAEENLFSCQKNLDICVCSLINIIFNSKLLR